MFLILLVILITLFAYYFHLAFVRPHQLWKTLNVAYRKPKLIFGNLMDFILGKKHLYLIYDDAYKSFPNEPYFGIYELSTPNLLVRDPEFINRILIKDFDLLRDRSMYVDEELDPLNAHLVTLKGDRWKTVRTKLSPVFSSGKLKQMYGLMEDCAKDLEQSLSSISDRTDEVSKNETPDVRELMIKFSMDVIGRCALGLECNAIRDPDSEFRRIGKKIFHFSYLLIIRVCLILINPKLVRWIRIKGVSIEVETFFARLLRNAVEQRKLDQRKNDFLQSMIDIQEQEKGTNDVKDIALTDDMLMANLFVFFAAGYETIANTLSFCLYELALNPNIQEKLREEIKSASTGTSRLDYDQLNSLPYLDMVVSETLRKYPSLPFINRVCNEDYTIPGTTIKLPKGTRLTIPVHSLHHDPEFFPNPESFEPERFENNRAYTNLYLPFGAGPRICIGLRLAKIEVKYCLASVLSKFSFEKDATTEIPVQIKARAIFLTPQNGIKLRIRKIS